MKFKTSRLGFPGLWNDLVMTVLSGTELRRLRSVVSCLASLHVGSSCRDGREACSPGPGRMQSPGAPGFHRVS